MSVRFPITAIHQVELTSRCNLRCRYCVHPKMPREKIDMDEETFGHVLRWAQHFVRQGTQRELNLAGIGESTMHEEFLRCVARARAALGWHVDITLATNGLLMTQELANQMARYKLKVWVSMHRPEKAGPAVEMLKSAGILHGVSADPSIAAIDWAGQVKWHVSHQQDMACGWVSTGRAFIMADGRVATCCLDGSGEDGVVGHITEDVASMTLAPYSLCHGCSYRIEGVNKDDYITKEEEDVAQ